MTKEGSLDDTTDEQLLTPEQLVVSNIEALMKARGVTRSELAKRLKALGFKTWQHEKTVRNLFDGVRRLRVDELFAMAAALNTSVMDLTSTDTRRAVFPEDKDLGPRMSLGTAVRGKTQYWSIWFGVGTVKIPTNHLNWAAWKPDEVPAWVNRLLQGAQAIVDLHRQLGFGEPPAPLEELTTEHLQEMMARITPSVEAKISSNEGLLSELEAGISE